MQNKYCLPIIKSSQEEILSTIQQANENYAYFEIWVDYIDNLDDNFIHQLVGDYETRLIFVFRRKFGHKPRMQPQKITQIIDLLSQSESMIDLDIVQNKEELEYIKKSNINLICSYHDYEKTPETSELEAKIDDMEEHNPSIIKISTFCDTENDALRLLELQQELIETGQKHIVLGMGENGLVTRIFGTLWGNELAFIPETTEDESAKGQIARDKFDRIMKELAE
jgi:3-dehydroquinate dehydratase-1